MFYIEKKDWNKVISYAQAAWDEHKSEIGGMMVVVKDEDGDWSVQDPVILKQVISAGNTHLDKEDLAKYYTKTAMKYKDNDFRFCWWHSHHTMQAFWSGTDTSTIDEYSDGDFSFALVVNLKEEYKFRVSVWKPIETHEDVDLEILNNERKVKQSIVNEVDKLCTKESYAKTKGIVKSSNYKNLHQPTLFNKQVDVVDENYNRVLAAVEMLNSRLVKGEIEYIDYFNRVTDINVSLEQEGSDYRVKVIAQEDQSAVLYLNASDFIDIEEEDVRSWNASFGIRGGL
jgi:hypothetical protein